jgi:hypothetical protein
MASIALAACAWKISGETNFVDEMAHSTQRRNTTTIDLHRTPIPPQPIYRYDDGRTYTPAPPCQSCQRW